MVKRRLIAVVTSLLFVLTILNMYSLPKTNAYDYLARGIDVSAYQGSINWNSVANDGIYFAIIRSGLGKYAFQEDKNFKTNYTNAKNAGIKVGTYWVSYAMSVDEAYEEAEICYSIIKDYNFDYPVYYDMEVSSQSNSLSKQQITNIGLAFCKKIASYGYTAGIYANRNWFTNYIDKAQIINNGYEIWLAQYPSGEYAVNPENYDKSSECSVWQYSSKGSISGISGNVDVNVSYKEFDVQTNLDSSMSISGESIPRGVLTPGKFFAVNGLVKSNLPIVKIWGGVYNKNGEATAQYAEAEPYTTTYDLSKYFDNKIIFNNLAVGYYIYRIQATDSTGKLYTLIESEFQIGTPETTVTTSTITTKETLPTTTSSVSTTTSTNAASITTSIMTTASTSTSSTTMQETTTIPTYTTTTSAITAPILSIEETEICLEMGKQYTIKANQKELSYSSDNTDVAVVSKTKGIITALREGDAVITISNNSGDTVKLKVTVIPVGIAGDANGDGNVTVADAVAILQYIGNKDKYNLSDAGKKNADVDGAAGITGMDALVIQQVDAGLLMLSDLPLN